MILFDWKLNHRKLIIVVERVLERRLLRIWLFRLSSQ